MIAKSSHLQFRNLQLSSHNVRNVRVAFGQSSESGRKSANCRKRRYQHVSNKQKNTRTWLFVDMEYLFSWSNLYLTNERSIELNPRRDILSHRGGGGGNFNLKRTGVLVANFEKSPCLSRSANASEISISISVRWSSSSAILIVVVESWYRGFLLILRLRMFLCLCSGVLTCFLILLMLVLMR